MLAEFGEVLLKTYFGVNRAYDVRPPRLLGCAFPADDIEIMPALQKPKDAPRIYKAATDAPPTQGTTALHSVRRHAVRVVPNVGQKRECTVTRKVYKCKRRHEGRLASELRVTAAATTSARGAPMLSAERGKSANVQ